MREVNIRVVKANRRLTQRAIRNVQLAIRNEATRRQRGGRRRSGEAVDSI